jgi:hypothetical protein
MTDLKLLDPVVVIQVGYPSFQGVIALIANDEHVPVGVLLTGNDRGKGSIRGVLGNFTLPDTHSGVMVPRRSVYKRNELPKIEALRLKRELATLTNHKNTRYKPKASLPTSPKKRTSPSKADLAFAVMEATATVEQALRQSSPESKQQRPQPNSKLTILPRKESRRETQPKQEEEQQQQRKLRSKLTSPPSRVSMYHNNQSTSSTREPLPSASISLSAALPESSSRSMNLLIESESCVSLPVAHPPPPSSTTTLEESEILIVSPPIQKFQGFRETIAASKVNLLHPQATQERLVKIKRQQQQQQQSQVQHQSDPPGRVSPSSSKEQQEPHRQQPQEDQLQKQEEKPKDPWKGLDQILAKNIQDTTTLEEPPRKKSDPEESFSFSATPSLSLSLLLASSMMDDENEKTSLKGNDSPERRTSTVQHQKEVSTVKRLFPTTITDSVARDPPPSSNSSDYSVKSISSIQSRQCHRPWNIEDDMPDPVFATQVIETKDDPLSAPACPSLSEKNMNRITSSDASNEGMSSFSVELSRNESSVPSMSLVAEYEIENINFSQEEGLKANPLNANVSSSYAQPAIPKELLPSKQEVPSSPTQTSAKSENDNFAHSSSRILSMGQGDTIEMELKSPIGETNESQSSNETSVKDTSLSPPKQQLLYDPWEVDSMKNSTTLPIQTVVSPPSGQQLAISDPWDKILTMPRMNDPEEEDSDDQVMDEETKRYLERRLDYGYAATEAEQIMDEFFLDGVPAVPQDFGLATSTNDMETSSSSSKNSAIPVVVHNESDEDKEEQGATSLAAPHIYDKPLELQDPKEYNLADQSMASLHPIPRKAANTSTTKYHPWDNALDRLTVVDIDDTTPSESERESTPTVNEEPILTTLELTPLAIFDDESISTNSTNTNTSIVQERSTAVSLLDPLLVVAQEAIPKEPPSSPNNDLSLKISSIDTSNENPSKELNLEVFKPDTPIVARQSDSKSASSLPFKNLSALLPLDSNISSSNSNNKRVDDISLQLQLLSSIPEEDIQPISSPKKEITKMQLLQSYNKKKKDSSSLATIDTTSIKSTEKQEPGYEEVKRISPKSVLEESLIFHAQLNVIERRTPSVDESEDSLSTSSLPKPPSTNSIVSEGEDPSLFQLDETAIAMIDETNKQEGIGEFSTCLPFMTAMNDSYLETSFLKPLLPNEQQLYSLDQVIANNNNGQVSTPTRLKRRPSPEPSLSLLPPRKEDSVENLYHNPYMAAAPKAMQSESPMNDTIATTATLLDEKLPRHAIDFSAIAEENSTVITKSNNKRGTVDAMEISLTKIEEAFSPSKKEKEDILEDKDVEANHQYLNSSIIAQGPWRHNPFHQLEDEIKAVISSAKIKRHNVQHSSIHQIDMTGEIQQVLSASINNKPEQRQEKDERSRLTSIHPLSLPGEQDHDDENSILFANTSVRNGQKRGKRCCLKCMLMLVAGTISVFVALFFGLGYSDSSSNSIRLIPTVDQIVPQIPSMFPTAAPTESPATHLEEFWTIAVLLGQENKWQDATHVQAALEWIVTSEDYYYSIGLSEMELQERFVLVLLKFATVSDDDWTFPFRFLSPKLSVCDWNHGGQGVFCDADNRVIEIALGTYHWKLLRFNDRN